MAPARFELIFLDNIVIIISSHTCDHIHHCLIVISIAQHRFLQQVRDASPIFQEPGVAFPLFAGVP